MSEKDASKYEDNSSDTHKIYSRPVVQVHDVYISDEISDPDGFAYVEMLQFLDTVRPRDYVRLRLKCHGGECHVGFVIAHAIKNCAATTVSVVEGPCSSMGAIIALSADMLYMNPGTHLMFHNYSTVEVGKAGEVRKGVDAYDKHNEASSVYFCSPFLSKKDFAAIRKDDDLYVHYNDKDLQARIKRHFKLQAQHPDLIQDIIRL